MKRHREDIVRYKIITKSGQTLNGQCDVMKLRSLKSKHLLYVELDDEILSFLESRKEDTK